MGDWLVHYSADSRDEGSHNDDEKIACNVNTTRTQYEPITNPLLYVPSDGNRPLVRARSHGWAVTG